MIPDGVLPIPDPHYWRDLWRNKKLALISTPGFEAAGTYWNNRKNVTGLYVKNRTWDLLAGQGGCTAQSHADPCRCPRS